MKKKIFFYSKRPPSFSKNKSFAKKSLFHPSPQKNEVLHETQIEEELFREKRAHDETKENIALKARTLSLVKRKLKEQELLLTVKELIITVKERELHQSRTDVIKYQKERMLFETE